MDYHYLIESLQVKSQRNALEIFILNLKFELGEYALFQDHSVYAYLVILVSLYSIMFY